VDDIDASAHQNLVGFTRWMARLEPDPPVLDADGVLVVVGETDWPSSRVGVRWADDLGAAGWADAADGFLRRHGEFGCIFARDGADDELSEVLIERGYTQYGTSPEMVRTERLPGAPAPAGTTVRIADAPAQVRGYAAVTARAFAHLGFLEEPTRRLLDQPAHLLADDVVLVVAERGDAVVGGAMVVFPDSSDAGYVAWVSCADEARGEGLGDAVTRAVTNAAFDRGARLVTLEASRFGAGTYRRMGYDTRYEYRLMIRTGSN
jgi:ribosomal protein S18 acetylase RimI-like enzyme